MTLARTDSAWTDSPFFQRFYHPSNTSETADFLQSITRPWQLPGGARLLHAGCGNGTLAREFAARGFEVTGIDPSPVNIEAAIKHGNNNPEYFLHDMRLPLRGSYFDLAYLSFPSFGMYRTRREHDDALRTLATSLKPGGRLIIDMPNVHFTEDQLVHNEVIEKNGTSYEIHRWDDDDFFHNRITVRDRSAPIPETFTESIVKLTLGDFNDMLSYQGLKLLDVYGNHDLAHYQLRSMPRLIITASRVL